MSTREDPSRISLEAFRQRLAHVLESNVKISEAIERVAARASRRPRTELQRVARFFARGCSPDDVLADREALSICLPLIKGGGGAATDAEIEASVQGWIHETRHHRWQAHRRLVAFAYPLLVAALTLVIVVLMCVFVVPVFGQMFDEFGLSLPAPTLLLIGLSHVIRHYGLALLVVGVFVAVGLWAVSRLRQRSGRSCWRAKFRHKFQSDRGALADWASRTASLIEAGLSRHEAVAVAGTLSGKGWLQRWAATGAEVMSEGVDPDEAQWSRIGRHRCHVFTHALRVPAAASQAALLRAAAATEIDRDQRRSGWWISTLSVLAVFFVGFLVGVMVLALLMPLVSLITGLS